MSWKSIIVSGLLGVSVVAAAEFSTAIGTVASAITDKAKTELKTSTLKSGKGYTTASGYSSSGSSSYYQNQQNKVHRYIYSAFQNGHPAGNMQLNHQGIEFKYLNRLGHYCLRMNRAGYSQLDLYFNKDRRYKVSQAQFSILERGVKKADKEGNLKITVNGRLLVSRYQSRYPNYFGESSWDISRMVKDGSNHISIKLGSRGVFNLLGLKVETDEYLKQNNNQTDYYQNVQFVNRVFRKHHFRYPSQQELDYYVGLLSRGYTRDEVRRSIKNQTSNGQNSDYTQLVEDYFIRYAKRRPTEYEKRHYVEKLSNGQLSLPELRRELELLAGNSNHTGNIESQVKQVFYEVVRRYPSTQELAYYRNKIINGSLSWTQLRYELQRLADGEVNHGNGFTAYEIRVLNFGNVNLDHSFYKKIDLTTDSLLRELLQRARFEEFNSSDYRVQNICRQVRRYINKRYPNL